MHFALIGSRGYPSTYGGFETFVRYFAPFVRDHGHQITVYCRGRPGRKRVWHAGGVRCIYTPGIENKSLSTLSYGATGAIDAAFRRFDAALVLNVANGFFLPLLRSGATPTALNVDGLEWRRGKWGSIARRVFKAGAWSSARWADRLVVDSRAIGDLWSEMFGVPSTFIPYGAPIPDQSASDRVEALGLVPGSYALVVARLIPENNVALSLDALERLRPAVPLVVAGTSGYRSDIEARLADLEDAGKVTWLRHVSDQVLLDQLWGHCRVYIHGHSVGGTNPALLQALGAGAPTLALDTPFNREVLGSDGRLYPLDASSLSALLARVVASDDERRRMRQAGQAIIRSRYQWDDVCHQYLELLEGLARASSAIHSHPPR